MNEPKPIREDLIAHLKEQISQDPEGYANDNKMKIAARRLGDSLGVPDWVDPPEERQAIRRCIVVMHHLTPVARLNVMESLVRFYLPDGSYHDRINPDIISQNPTESESEK